VTIAALIVACRTGQADLPQAAREVDPLIEAALAGHDAEKLANLLRLGRPTDPDRLARRAVQTGDLSLVRILHATGFDVNAGVGGNGESLLAAAARIGSAPVIRFLLERGADPNGRYGPGAAYVPMYEAIRWNHISAAAELLEGHADPNARILIDPQGEMRAASSGPTLLMLAVATGTPDIVELLLAWGADAQLRDWEGRAATDWLGRRDDAVTRIRAALVAAGGTERQLQPSRRH
jgi:ankyrin repeat protein